MPQRRERALLYIRESDTTLAWDSTTMESAVKALLAHAEKKGYDVIPDNIHREAISGYHVYYFDRPELMKALKKVERGEVDVFLVTEIRALSRRGAGEVLIIYNILQKSNIRLETLSESITDDLGEVLLTFRATWARIEREQAYIRMQRGKRDRIEIGNAPPNGRRAYGFLLIDTEKETSARYVYNTETIHIDANGDEWSEIKVRKFILDQALSGATLWSIVVHLNDLGIPPPRKPFKGAGSWMISTVSGLAKDTINYGEVWVNKYQRVDGKMRPRPREEWIKLPDGIAPAIITKEQHNSILHNIQENRRDSLRNKHHPEQLGLLRGGYIFCAICGRRMSVRYGGSGGKGRKEKAPCYRCVRIQGKTVEELYQHRNTIALNTIEPIVKEKIVETLMNPEIVHRKANASREANRPVVNQNEVANTITDISKKMQNLYRLAENATDDETIVHLSERLNELEHQKRGTEKLLYVLEDNEEEREAVEQELQHFEKWAANIQPFLKDKEHINNASYDELRLAIKILGIRVWIYPLNGDYPFRYQIEMTVPEALAKIDID